MKAELGSALRVVSDEASRADFVAPIGLLAENTLARGLCPHSRD